LTSPKNLSRHFVVGNDLNHAQSACANGQWLPQIADQSVE